MKIITIMLISVYLLCGCSDNSEIRNRAFVQSIGIVATPDEYNVCVRLFGDDENVYYGSGINFDEAIDDAERVQGNDFLTGHTEMTVVSVENSNFILKQLVNEDISSGCIVVFNDDPISFVSENDTKILMDVITTAVRNGKYKKINICDAINS